MATPILAAWGKFLRAIALIVWFVCFAGQVRSQTKAVRASIEAGRSDRDSRARCIETVVTFQIPECASWLGSEPSIYPA